MSLSALCNKRVTIGQIGTTPDIDQDEMGAPPDLYAPIFLDVHARGNPARPQEVERFARLGIEVDYKWWMIGHYTLDNRHQITYVDTSTGKPRYFRVMFGRDPHELAHHTTVFCKEFPS